MAADKLAAFARANLRILQAALPLQHRPAVKIIFCELAENRFEIDLPVAQRTKTPRPLLPVLIAAVDPAAPAAAEFGIFDVKRFDPRMIDIDVTQVVHLLKM